MKKIATYIVDALANAFGQAILFFAGLLFAWYSAAGFAVWLIAAAGFGVLLSVMERGAERKCGVDRRNYMLFSVFSVNAIALVFGAVSGIGLLTQVVGGIVPVFAVNPYYPLFIVIGSLWVTLSFLVADRLVRRKA
ncbi:MAG: hypothetical protein ACI4XA_11175 [Oscillospiraceae bacterium]